MMAVGSSPPEASRAPSVAPRATAPVQPIFLLSLPRSGSTLVQRMLATYPAVSTTSEPWIMLPLLTPLRRGTPGDVGWQRTLNTAVAEFAARLRGGEERYRSGVQEFAMKLYAEAATPGARYFLDKTPPYHWIADELFELFPQGRFVFLWRNPIAVASSTMETWQKGHWRPDRSTGALFSGVENLVDAFERHRDRALGLRYEDLLDPSGDAWRSLTDYLELPFNPQLVEAFPTVTLDGQTGDPTGTVRYSRLSQEPLVKWRTTAATPLRRAWCRRYLRWIGERRLNAMGYSLDGLLDDLAQLDVRYGHLPHDVLDVITSRGREVLLARLRPDRPPGSWARLNESPRQAPR